MRPNATASERIQEVIVKLDTGHLLTESYEIKRFEREDFDERILPQVWAQLEADGDAEISKDYASFQDRLWEQARQDYNSPASSSSLMRNLAHKLMRFT